MILHLAVSVSNAKVRECLLKNVDFAKKMGRQLLADVNAALKAFDYDFEHYKLESISVIELTKHDILYVTL